jgi:hypothetical protein
LPQPAGPASSGASTATASIDLVSDDAGGRTHSADVQLESEAPVRGMQTDDATSAPHLQRLVHEAFRLDSLRGLGVLTEVVAAAAGASGAIMWEAAEARSPSAPLSVLAFWLDEAAASAGGFPTVPDPITLSALETRTLAVPSVGEDMTGPSSSFGVSVRAALAFEYLDGKQGVLTLLGQEELTGQSFDVTADLLDILPELCDVLRERQTLALVHSCNRILDEADLESPDQPLGPDRLGDYLRRVCVIVAETLQCDVSIFLQEPAASDDVFPLFASSSEPPPNTRSVPRNVGWTGWSAEHGKPIAVPVVAGDGA